MVDTDDLTVSTHCCCRLVPGTSLRELVPALGRLRREDREAIVKRVAVELFEVCMRYFSGICQVWGDRACIMVSLPGESIDLKLVLTG